jgi:hypothetical protein
MGYKSDQDQDTTSQNINDTATTMAPQQANKTGIPDTMKALMEYTYQVSLNDVRVHYNATDKIEQKSKELGRTINAYAEYPDIYIAKGFEHCLQEEVKHIIQQLKGDVKPTGSVEGQKFNDDPRLETLAKKDDLGSGTGEVLDTTELEEATKPVDSVAQFNELDGVEDAPPQQQENEQEQQQQVVVEEEQESELLVNLRRVLHEDLWNDRTLVEAIGSESWTDINEAWVSLTDATSVEAKKKLQLLRLKGSNDEVDLSTYDGWTDITMGEQRGHKWGTETEGGGISVKLKKALSYQKVGITQEEKPVLKKDLKEKLTYFKRTPLIKTAKYNLALDNINDKVDKLLERKVVSLPLEIASKAFDGELDTLKRADVLRKENRKLDDWPTLKKSGSGVAVKKGEDVCLTKFNEYFLTQGAPTNIIRTQKPQHITKSGAEEDRLSMAKELQEVAIAIEFGTSGKKALSGKPKTALEFLRKSDMTEEQVAELEAYGKEIRKQIKAKLGADIKFADENLNGLVVPITGAPRNIGGYTLATPMTNVFPLLQKRQGKVTTLREYR